MDRLLLTISEACSLLSVRPTTVYQLLRRGELRSVKVGRLRRIPLDAVKDYIRRLEESQSGK